MFSSNCRKYASWISGADPGNDRKTTPYGCGVVAVGITSRAGNRSCPSLWAPEVGVNRRFRTTVCPGASLAGTGGVDVNEKTPEPVRLASPRSPLKTPRYVIATLKSVGVPTVESTGMESPLL